jgi:hypothetical protein
MDQGRIVRDGPVREVLGEVDSLCGLGIYPPQATQMADYLKREYRVNFEQIPINIEEAKTAFSIIRRS